MSGLHFSFPGPFFLSVLNIYYLESHPALLLQERSIFALLSPGRSAGSLIFFVRWYLWVPCSWVAAYPQHLLQGGGGGWMHGTHASVGYRSQLWWGVLHNVSRQHHQSLIRDPVRLQTRSVEGRAAVTCEQTLWHDGGGGGGGGSNAVFCLETPERWSGWAKPGQVCLEKLEVAGSKPASTFRLWTHTCCNSIFPRIWQETYIRRQTAQHNLTAMR